MAAFIDSSLKQGAVSGKLAFLSMWNHDFNQNVDFDSSINIYWDFQMEVLNAIILTYWSSYRDSYFQVHSISTVS